MRIGSNPEKKKFKEITYRSHRVIIPVFIPNTEENYYKQAFDVFKTSIKSLTLTINKKSTAITIINNNSNKKVSDYINCLLEQGEIDKHVRYTINYGKVYVVLAEAKASYEDYVTIADADVLYFNRWESQVFEIFNQVKNVGVVSPVPAPHLTFYNNVSLFGSFVKRYKKGNVVDASSFDLFEKGINNLEIFNSKKNNWKKSQYFIEKNNIKACVGCGHFVATYKRQLFDKISSPNPKYVFLDGDENEKIDTPIDKLGYYRLSTCKAYAYHLGNTIPTWLSAELGKLTVSPEFKLNNSAEINEKHEFFYPIRKLMFKFLVKYVLRG